MGQEEHLQGAQLKGIRLDFSTLKMDCKQYYPNDLVYELMMPANLLKKIEGMKQIHKLIDTAKDAGVLTR